MTEQQWLTCERPERMLDFLRQEEYEAWRAAQTGGEAPESLRNPLRPRATNRKLRLFGCACCRRVWPLFTSRRSLEAVVAVEGVADRLPWGNNLPAARQEAWKAVQAFPQDLAARAAHLLTVSTQEGRPLLERVVEAARLCAEAAVAGGLAFWGAERAAQAALVREVFGNPLRPAAPAFVSVRADPTVARVAQAIHEEGRFEEVPVLGDALEEAGCADPAILAHCRSDKGHVRGCWVLDLVRGVG
jgi:hypothetical protein